MKERVYPRKQPPHGSMRGLLLIIKTVSVTRNTGPSTRVSDRRRGSPMREVSLLSGFYDTYYFSRVFRHATGLSPRQYQETEFGRE